VCTNPALFRRRIPLLRKKPSNSEKKHSDLQKKNVSECQCHFF